MYRFLLGLCEILLFTNTVDGACEPGWVGFQDSCYTLVTAFRQWSDAKKFCEQMNNTHLVIVMTQEENEFLKSVLRTRGATPEVQFWMDGVDMKTEGEWVWERTGERWRMHSELTFEITDWYPGEPNQSNGEEDCLTFYTRYDMRWNDEHCDRLFPFLCERDSVPAGILG